MKLFGSNNRLEQKIEEKIWCIEKRDAFVPVPYCLDNCGFLPDFRLYYTAHSFLRRKFL